MDEDEVCGHGVSFVLTKGMAKRSTAPLAEGPLLAVLGEGLFFFQARSPNLIPEAARAVELQVVVGGIVF